MRRGVRMAAALSVMVLLFGASGLTHTGSKAAAQEPSVAPIELQTDDAEGSEGPRLEQFSVDPRDPPIQVGDVVPIHVVVDPGQPLDALQIHITADRQSTGMSRDAEIEPRPETAPGGPALQVGFWEPSEPGRYELSGHVHLGEQTLDLPLRTATVQPAAAQDADVQDGSSLQVGIAPGTVLWALVFMGLAYAAQRHQLDDEG